MPTLLIRYVMGLWEAILFFVERGKPRLERYKRPAVRSLRASSPKRKKIDSQGHITEQASG